MMGRTKIGLWAAVTAAILAVPVMVAAAGSPAPEKNEHGRTTVFDIFELSPEQFATVMSKSDE
jgi:hypothetical protein